MRKIQKSCFFKKLKIILANSNFQQLKVVGFLNGLKSRKSHFIKKKEGKKSKDDTLEKTKREFSAKVRFERCFLGYHNPDQYSCSRISLQLLLLNVQFF